MRGGHQPARARLLLPLLNKPLELDAFFLHVFLTALKPPTRTPHSQGAQCSAHGRVRGGSPTQAWPADGLVDSSETPISDRVKKSTATKKMQEMIQSRCGKVNKNQSNTHIPDSH